jgi:hypothetical protein
LEGPVVEGLRCDPQLSPARRSCLLLYSGQTAEEEKKGTDKPDGRYVLVSRVPSKRKKAARTNTFDMCM